MIFSFHQSITSTALLAEVLLKPMPILSQKTHSMESRIAFLVIHTNDGTHEGFNGIQKPPIAQMCFCQTALSDRCLY